MKILLIDNGTTLLEKLQKLVPGSNVVNYADVKVSEFPDFDLIVLSGSSTSSVELNHNDFKKRN